MSQVHFLNKKKKTKPIKKIESFHAQIIHRIEYWLSCLRNYPCK